MNRKLLVLFSATLAAATVAAGTAFADDHRRRGSEGGRVERSAEHGSARVAERAAPHVEGRAVERAVPRAVAPELRGGRYDNRAYGRPVIIAPRRVYPYAVRPYVVRPFIARPYVFRPRLSIGLGFFVGYPVPYAYAYPYPVPVYGYGAPAGSVYVGPGTTMYGGVSLEITPPDASVYVDGGYAGLVQDFDGSRQTLTLANGRHRIDISAPGYEPMTFDVDVVPGQIVPYRGDLEPVR